MSDLVTYAWCAGTGGALAPEQKRLLLRRALRTYGQHAGGLVRLATGRRAGVDLRLPEAPDAALVEATLAAAADQGPDLEAHGFRSWLFGGTLAASDGVAIDPELFFVAGLAHDAGAAEVVPGEDFTLRSAAVGVKAFADAGRALGEEDATALRDGIVAHATAGVTVEDSAIGTYVQAGAMLDLVGLRLADLPKALVNEVFARHPVGGFRDTIRRSLAAEARAVPDGRFAQLQRLGLPLAVRLSPTLRGRP